MKRSFRQISDFITRHNLHVLKGVFLFIVITLAIHYSFRFWAYKARYWPLGDQMIRIESHMASVVFHQSIWVDRHILGIEVEADPNNYMHFLKNGNYIIINNSCSGLKQILQFVLLFLVYPGPWRKKLWYIPLGVLLVHLTNIIRIAGLSVVTINVPQHWEFSHDYIFRPLFYVVIFSMWVLWVEKISKK